MKFEPLIVHLFKLFARAHDLKKEENKPTTSVSNEGKVIQPAKNYDGQNENMTTIKSRPEIADASNICPRGYYSKQNENRLKGDL